MKIKIITPLGEFKSMCLEKEEVENLANKFFAKKGFINLCFPTESGTCVIPDGVAKQSIFLTIE